MKTILIVFGTRPEAIKLAPLILLAKADNRFKTLVCSTGQHREMLKPILSFFEITPDYDLNLMSPGQTLTDVSTKTLNGIDSILKSTKVDIVITQGDTTTGFAASLAAFYNQVSVAHVEAGLRSGNITSPFPEEFNRKAISLIAKWHFPPTELSRNNLINEGLPKRDIVVTGNTGIDALMRVRSIIENKPELSKDLEKNFSFLDAQKKLILVTLHRRESFGAPMEEVMKGLLKLSERSDLQFLIPVHLNPNVRQSISRVLGNKAQWVGSSNAEKKSSNIWLCEPVDYVPFIYLMMKAHIIVTDSGGVQEEAPSLGKPVLIARENTERPEAIEAGTSMLVPLNEREFVAETLKVLDDGILYKRMSQSINPFGDGLASAKILDVLAQN
ncbi:non-hydrolyzing UDP-N-acetylglucosamine 2-epimerase [Bdellovibrio sp. HCB288]|uniref:non-hydrolyzing UDP-N-acetylglucosamine 2-epimerase n=1 Tax=Bdellovibrio sp. HCB288 TaxID=3394355 RepID=UPI0039B3E173